MPGSLLPYPLLLPPTPRAAGGAARKKAAAGAFAAASTPTQLIADPTTADPRLAAGLVNALKSRALPFALCEWFYPTLDRAFFNEDAFGDALDAAGLGHLRAAGQRLTRTEWGAVRAALGKPRRLSPAFFRQERRQLEAYRSVVRGLQQGHLASPPPGAWPPAPWSLLGASYSSSIPHSTSSIRHMPQHDTGFAYEVPARLEVGQEVTAYHKAAQLLARGHILTVDYERGRYRVQFERPELDSEICAVRVTQKPRVPPQTTELTKARKGSNAQYFILFILTPPTTTQIRQDTDIAVQGAPALIFARPRRPAPALLASSALALHHRAIAALLLPSQLLAPDVERRRRRRHGTCRDNECNSAVGAVQGQERLWAFVRKMLDRKEALVAALRTLNEQAEAAGVEGAPASTAGGGGLEVKKGVGAGGAAASKGAFWGGGAAAAAGASVAVELSPVLEQQYAWVVQALQRTNAALVPAMELLRQARSGDERGGGGDGDGDGAAGGGERVQQVVDAARAEARRLYEHHRACKMGDLLLLGGDPAAGEAVLAQAGPVQSLVEAASALIFTLRRCAEERKRPPEEEAAAAAAAAAGEEELQGQQGEKTGAGQAGGRSMVALGVEQCVGAAMEGLKRRVLLMLAAASAEREAEQELPLVYEEALGLLTEVAGSVASLKQEMLL